MLQRYWGERVREVRANRSQTWLAAEAHVDQTTISRLERGKYKFSPQLMLDLAVALDMELEQLFRFPPGLASRRQYEREVERRSEAA